MRFMRSSYPLLLLMLFLQACDEWDLTQKEDGEQLVTVEFTGQVIERLSTAVGIPNAEVLINGQHAYADASGNYSLSISMLESQLGNYEFEVRAQDFQSNSFRSDNPERKVVTDIALERLRFVDISTSTINMGLFEHEVALRIANNTSYDVAFDVNSDDANVSVYPSSGIISSSHATHDFVDVIVAVDRTVFTNGVRRSTITADVGNASYAINLVYETRNPDNLNWVDEDNDRLIDIRNIDDLYRLSLEHARDTFNAFIGFELVNDLDFQSDDSYKNTSLKTQLTSGEGWVPIGHTGNTRFARKFEGNGFTISNLYINRESDYIGLFAFISETASVENVVLQSVSVKGKGSVAGLVGANSGSIKSCSVDGSVEGVQTIGLVVGWHQDGSIISSQSNGLARASGNICGGLIGAIGGSGGDLPVVSYCYSTATVRGESYIGGLLGSRYNGFPTISSCYATGRVIANGRSVGGLVGYFAGEMKNCYAKGQVESNSYNIGGLIGENVGLVVSSYSTGGATGSSAVGGFIGRNSGSVPKSNYWDISTSGITSSSAGSGYPTATLQGITTDVSIYLTWDEDSWDFGSSSEYPALKGMPGGLESQR